jgi:hypothetical protein
MCRFVLAMVLAASARISPLYRLRFVTRPDVDRHSEGVALPPPCAFWPILASLHLGIARQLLSVRRHMRQRVWRAARVGLTAVAPRTGTAVLTLFGRQVGARKGSAPGTKASQCYLPIPTLLPERREFIGVNLHNAGRPGRPGVSLRASTVSSPRCRRR